VEEVPGDAAWTAGEVEHERLGAAVSDRLNQIGQHVEAQRPIRGVSLLLIVPALEPLLHGVDWGRHIGGHGGRRYSVCMWGGFSWLGDRWPATSTTTRQGTTAGACPMTRLRRGANVTPG
jgi:hypothetical protein